MSKVVLLIEPASAERRAFLSELLSQGVDVIPVETASQAIREFKEPVDGVLLRLGDRQLALRSIITTALRYRSDVKIFAMGATAAEAERFAAQSGATTLPLEMVEAPALAQTVAEALGIGPPEPAFRLHLTERVFGTPRETLEAWRWTRSDDDSPILRFGSKGDWQGDPLADLAVTVERAARVEHRFLPPSGGVWASDTECFGVSQLSIGETLAARLRRESMSTARTATLVRQLAQAIGALHASPDGAIWVGPLTPAQIWMRPSEEPWLLCAGASAIALRNERKGHAHAQALIPTSAEETMGEPMNERTDVFYLGCFVYELLSGAEPYPRDSDALRHHAAVRSGKFRDLRVYRPSLPDAVAAVLGRALAPDPKLRPTLAEIDEALSSLERAPAPAPAAAPRAPEEEASKPWWKFWSAG